MLHARDVASGTIYSTFYRVGANGLLGQFVLNGAKAGNGLFELLALVGILNRFIDELFASTNHPSSQFDAANVEDVKGDFVAFSDFSQQVFRRYLYIFKEHLAGRRPFDTQFLFFGANGHAFPIALYDEAGKFIAIYLSKDGEDIGKACIGDPHFLSIEDVVAAIFRQDRLSFGRKGIRTRSRLCQTVSGVALPSDTRGQVFLLLVFSAKIEDGQHANTRMGTHREGERFGRCHDGREGHVGFKILHESTVLFWKRGAQETLLACFAQQFFGQLNVEGLNLV